MFVWLIGCVNVCISVCVCVLCACMSIVAKRHGLHWRAFARLIFRVVLDNSLASGAPHENHILSLLLVTSLFDFILLFSVWSIDKVLSTQLHEDFISSLILQSG